jgi:hypothetical protein
MQRLDHSSDWQNMLRNRVDRTLSSHPPEACVTLGLIFARFFHTPGIEEQERYVTELMRKRGYRFVSSQTDWVARRVTYRRQDVD